MRGLGKSFSKGRNVNDSVKYLDKYQVIRDLNLDIYCNRIHTILGPSGSGKTTLLNIISGLITEYEGDLIFSDKPIFSYLFQEDRLLKWLTVYDNIKLVVENRCDINDINKEIDYYLDVMGLADYKHQYPNKLSGGMMQRVSAIRAFVYPSNFMLMDEPFKSQDIKTKIKLMDSVILSYERKKKTILFVTHSIDEALYMSHHIHLLSDKPSKILKTYDIDKPLNNRDITQEYYMTLEQDIYRRLLA